MSSVARVDLTAELIEAFAGTFLSPLYDNPQPTPQLHRDCWKLYCSGVELAAIAAPREHAKSTALTHNYGLATALFRAQDYIVIVSATEELAMGHMSDIAKELRENEDLIREFKIKGLVTDSKSDIIVEFLDGHQARFIAKGAGQKMRGMKWNGKRPGLIICDDLEEDEQVENYDRRKKFRRWFYRALLPCRRRGGLVRMHGTILHEDALLSRLLRATTWSTKLFRAHTSFSEFTDILWPEQFPEARLRSIRQAFIDDGDAAGYSQEYLNDPFDNSDAYLRKDDFLAMTEEEYWAQKSYSVGVDFAVSKLDRANRTSFTVGGKMLTGKICVVDQHVGRWDALEWIEKMFDIDSKWNPDHFAVEGGVIWNALEATIYQAMRDQDHYLKFLVINPVKDKATRGKPYQKRHRAGGILFDKKAEWYPEYEAENLRFTGTGDALQDDQFDSTAILVKGFEASPDPDEDDFIEEEELEMRRHDPRILQGRSAVTGY